jgi:hypothetical protein
MRNESTSEFTLETLVLSSNSAHEGKNINFISPDLSTTVRPTKFPSQGSVTNNGTEVMGDSSINLRSGVYLVMFLTIYLESVVSSSDSGGDATYCSMTQWKCRKD